MVASRHVLLTLSDKTVLLKPFMALFRRPPLSDIGLLSRNNGRPAHDTFHNNGFAYFMSVVEGRADLSRA
jgi:hypothetical protein